MHFVALTLGTILLSIACISHTDDGTNKCYIARTCIHSGIERCGRNSTGDVRRFIDSCDLLEYNCLYKTDYSKVSPDNCENIPPIPAEEKLVNQTESKENKINEFE